MNKHTPGPWSVSSPVDKTTHEPIVQYIIYSINGQHICEKRILESKKHQHAANAKLIAAAPDLLDALIAARDELAKYIVFREHPELTIPINEAIKKATI